MLPFDEIRATTWGNIAYRTAVKYARIAPPAFRDDFWGDVFADVYSAIHNGKATTEVHISAHSRWAAIAAVRSYGPIAKGVSNYRHERNHPYYFDEDQYSRPFLNRYPNDSPDPSVVAEDHIEHAISSLTDEQRDILQWKFVEGVTNGEIGKRLGVSYNIVAKRLKRMYQKLRVRIPESTTPQP